jgi:hypothetical protein
MNGFKIFGYNVDFYDRKKFVGSLRLDEPDRDLMGYAGRKQLAYKGILTKGTKKVKVDGVYLTECIPLCGRLK